MALPYDRTEAGGREEAFRTTRWSEILRSRTQDADRRQATLNELLRRYWKPVYCYLRRKGQDNETAKDLTQGFFHEVVLGRHLIQRAESAKGRFRTFLLTALDRYVTSVHRAEAAKKRRPASGLVSLEAAGLPEVPEPTRAASPEDAFNHAWASALLDSVLTETERRCAQTGTETHWKVFYARVIAPILENAEPTPLPDLCATYGIATETVASNMIVTVKRRFQAVLRNEVRQFVDSDEEVDEEVRDLIGMLAKPGG